MIQLEEVKAELEKSLGVQTELSGSGLLVPKSRLLDVFKFLKENAKYQMDYISNLCAVDYLKQSQIEIVYHLYSMRNKTGPIGIKVRTDRQDCIVPSATPLFRGAEFQEREAFDLYGVKFEGHTDLRRILMWDGFEGFPMRKDYVHEDEDRYVEHP
ncbi:MAG: NADH-quinone oxidoreductase subunit C [Candidatus Omnitrophica bacterium]|nr:NADH-quinone oxidoreductase subunit C [Candidatus Omnitrophota bacterium]